MKKAFTLIELLGVIILLAIIALVVYPIVDKVIENSRNEAYLRSVENLETAARTYGTINNLGYSGEKKTLSISTLKNAGLIKDNDIKNPKTNGELQGCIIYNWDSNKNQYKYEYSEECLIETDESCFEYEEQEIVLSYDINIENCISVFSEQFDEENAVLFCNGETVMGMSFESLITEQPEALEQLEEINVIYNVVSKNGVIITRYLCGGIYDWNTDTFTDGPDMNPTIPTKINNQDVITLGEESFYSTGIYSVKLPESIIKIESYIFAGTRLSSIDLSPLKNINYIAPRTFCNVNISRDNFIGINEYTYDYFEYECIDR